MAEENTREFGRWYCQECGSRTCEGHDKKERCDGMTTDLVLAEHIRMLEELTDSDIELLRTFHPTTKSVDTTTALQLKHNAEKRMDLIYKIEGIHYESRIKQHLRRKV